MKMKSILAGLLLLGSLNPVFAQLTIPSDGSDLAFNPAASIEVDLSQAIPGDALTFSNTGGNQGKGIYDVARWVIVFKYASVNIPAGVTVTFKNHYSYAPVVWLVQGSVTIAGTVSVDGKSGVTGPDSVYPVESGPGGFRGAAAGPAGSGAGPGRCVTVRGCAVVMNLLSRDRRGAMSHSTLQLLQRAHCGFTDTQPLVSTLGLLTGVQVSDIN